MIAPNVILAYDSTHASIPSGWTRETSLDGKYPKGTADSTNPNTTGGATTHSHTSPSHTHTMVSHTHTGTSGVNSGGGISKAGSGAAKNTHTHSYTTGGVSSGGSTNSESVTYASFSNDPNYYTVIFIKASSYTTIPNNAMVFSASTTRSGLTFHTASANKFLKGAGTGANAGSTGGTTTNAHTISHTHTSTAHTHSSGNTGGANQQVQDIGADYDTPSSGHTHTFTVGSTTATVNTFSSALSLTETVQPAYTTLNAFKNESGSSVMPAVGDIALWLGTLATIPVGWKLCDGTNDTPDMRGRYYKNPATASASTTGGSNTHTHAAVSHTHTSPSHAHSVSFNTITDKGARKHTGYSDGPPANSNHGHSTANCNGYVAVFNSSNTTANSSDNQPEYRTVAFIQFEFPPVMPNPILKMLIDTVENWG